MDREEFLPVFEHLLGDRLEGDEFQQLIEDAFQLIKYSVGRFRQELVGYAGYSAAYALTVARQIVPKPVLYSSVIYNLVHDGKLVPTFETSEEGRLQRQAFYALQYDLLAPSFTAFLYDQTIDDFNTGYRDNNLIEAEVRRAASVLADQPDYYRQNVFELAALCMDGEVTADDLPDRLKPYWLLTAYVNRLRDTDLQHGEIEDILYTVSDVLVHEHLAELSHAASDDREVSFARPHDFLDDVLGTVHEQRDGRFEAVARAILRGQGFLMVSVSQFTLYKLEPVSDGAVGYRLILREDAFDASAREVLRDCLYLGEGIRMYELVVRIGDDAGDLELDRKHHAPNAILSDPAVRESMLRLSGLLDVPVDTRARQSFQALLKKEASGEAEQADFATAVVDNLLAMEGAITHYLNTQWLIDAGAAAKAPAKLLIGIMRWVVFGSIVNASFNDDFAEQMGKALDKTA